MGSIVSLIQHPTITDPTTSGSLRVRRHRPHSSSSSSGTASRYLYCCSTSHDTAFVCCALQRSAVDRCWLQPSRLASCTVLFSFPSLSTRPGIVFSVPPPMSTGSAASVLPLTAPVAASISRGRWLCAMSSVLLIHAALQAMQCKSHTYTQGTRICLRSKPDSATHGAQLHQRYVCVSQRTVVPAACNCPAPYNSPFVTHCLHTAAAVVAAASHVLLVVASSAIRACQ